MMEDGGNSAAVVQGPSSGELLRLAIESATDCAIIAIDPDGLILSWNSGAQRLLGYSEQEIVGRDGDVIFVAEDRAAGIPSAERDRALADGRAESERWYQRADGSRFWGSDVLMPLPGAIKGFTRMLRDETRRHEVEQDLRQSEARLRALAHNIPQLVFWSRVTGERVWGGPQWELFSGLSDGRSRAYGWLEVIHPDDREASIAAWRAAQASGHYYVEHRVRRSVDGEYRWHQTRARPVQDQGGSDDWVGTSTDIHELRCLQDRQQILFAELQHRTRNLLAVVQAIVRQTVRTSESLEEFAERLESRLRALSRVQGHLARTDQRPVNLRWLVETELEAYGDGTLDRDKVRIDGPDVSVPADAAQALTLALHELATNAVKYGALKAVAAKLAVTWRIGKGAGGEPRLILDWRESGVPMSPAPEDQHQGYGSELIRRALPYQLKAATRLVFGEDGVQCTIDVPLATPGETRDHG